MPGRATPGNVREVLMVVVMVVRLIGLAKQVEERAKKVENRPAHVQPIKAIGHASDEEVQNQVGTSTHQQARKGNELEAVQGRRPVKFGVVHRRNREV
jgi:hypothetical protein